MPPVMMRPGGRENANTRHARAARRAVLQARAAKAAGDERLAAIFADTAAMAIGAHLDELRKGKLEQTCPTCHQWEAAGPYCSRCWAATGPDCWYGNGDQAERMARGAEQDRKADRLPPRTPAAPLKQGRKPRAAIGAHASREARLS